MDLQLAVDPYKRDCLCAFWKHGLTSKNIPSHLIYFCKSNINQIFTNGGDMIWGVRIAIFTEIRHLVEELITFLSIYGPQKLGIFTGRLNKNLSISTSIQWEGISVLKHAQSLHSYCENNSFWKTLWWDMWAMMHASKVSWIGIIVCGRACEQWCKVTWIGIIVFCNRMEDMPLYHIFKLIILLFGFIMMFDTYKHVFAEFWYRLHWLKTLGLMLCNSSLEYGFIIMQAVWEHVQNVRICSIMWFAFLQFGRFSHNVAIVLWCLHLHCACFRYHHHDQHVKIP